MQLSSFINKFFLSFYSNYLLTKTLFFKKIKNFIFSFNYRFLENLTNSSYLFWQFIFKKNFWINRKKKIKFISKLQFSDYSFFFIENKKNFFQNTNLIKNNFFIYFFFNNFKNLINFIFLNFIKVNLNFKKSSIYFLDIYKRTFGESFFYLRGLFIIFFIDACITDDEPLWEPIEWSLVQTWLLFIFIFAWIAENLITSRFGSYTGRDKRVWFAWYKSFWLIDLIYAISYGLAALFVIIPFYFELTYSLSFVFSWWNWYTRVFFFKFISIFSIIILLAHLLQLNLRWLNWKKLFFFYFNNKFFYSIFTLYKFYNGLFWLFYWSVMISKNTINRLYSIKSRTV